MTFSGSGESATDTSEPRLHIQPFTRRKFTPASLPDGGTDPLSLVPTSSPVSPAAGKSFKGRLLLPAKSLASAAPHSPSLPIQEAPKISPRLHPALEDIEQQETRAMPQFIQPAAAYRDAGRLAPSYDTDPLAELAVEQVMLYRQDNFVLYTACRPGQQAPPLRKPSGLTAKIARPLPQQRERVAISPTRRIPKVDLREIRRTATLPIPLWLESAAVLLLLAGVICLHAYNLFLFPAYTMDEGTYMQNAWAITIGKLSPYPYGYGHPPAGWLQIALWIKLSGLFSFGSAINSGRLLMLLYAAGGALLVYALARRLTGSKSAALLALALFAFSPLSVVLQREVLLDNIATFWLLLALYLVVVSRSRLPYLAAAALVLGLALLSKEVLATVLPAMVYFAWLHITPFQRKFALVMFLYITLAMFSTFVLLALLKGELFPYAWHLPWDHHPHLSLLDTYVEQVQRGQNQGSLWQSWQVWWREDAPLMAAALLAPVFNVLTGWRARQRMAAGLLALSYWLLLVRGGVVYIFYLIPLLALSALNVALALHVLLGWLSRGVRLNWLRAVLLLLLLSLLLPYNIIGSARQVSARPVLAQQQALTWIRAHLPRHAYIVTDAYLYLDLHQPGNDGPASAPAFPRAEVYWNVATDPAIRTAILHDDWNNIDYLIVDEQMLQDMRNNSASFTILHYALARSNLLVTFQAHDALEDITLQIYQVRHQTTPLV